MLTRNECIKTILLQKLTGIKGEIVASDQSNPYSTPQTDSAATPQGEVAPGSVQKIEAIIKDAGQFWLAILMCIVCTGLGALIIGPWYLVRLVQWHAIARAQPMLVDPNALRGSLARRFQTAKIKLVIGMSFGALIFFLVALLVLASLVPGPAA